MGGELPPGRRCRRRGQHGQGVRVGEVGPERLERGRVEVSEGGAELVGELLAPPDQILVTAGQHFEGLDLGGVGGDGPVEVAVGADHLGQHQRVEGVAFDFRGSQPVPVSLGDLRVHGVDLGAAGDQGAD
jgi:hypothetical protein